MVYEFFELVTVGYFPFTDIQKYTPRPALVVSSHEYQRIHDSCLCLMITTTDDKREDDIEVTDLQLAGLFEPSRIRFKVGCIDIGQIRGRIGTIDNHTKAVVMDKIAHYFGMEAT